MIFSCAVSLLITPGSKLENALSVGANTVIPVVVLFACAWNSSPTLVALSKLKNVPNCPAPSIIWVMFTGGDALGAAAVALMTNMEKARLQRHSKDKGPMGGR
ncbi:hypothetical protein GOP47_0012057 [Adiantum capillus-veneris]|uniref:Uncharacterized protein n=1 Tax=Adiantum capillus-veneris TaxID=13818 RepID=A0A9D4UTY3_ADICA|nr:hypothetical protein GOP47_0012057 [Adiantum capillus-veneris]